MERNVNSEKGREYEQWYDGRREMVMPMEQSNLNFGYMKVIMQTGLSCSREDHSWLS